MLYLNLSIFFIYIEEDKIFGDFDEGKDGESDNDGGKEGDSDIDSTSSSDSDDDSTDGELSDHDIESKSHK